MRKVTDYFFIMLDLGPTSFVNRYLFTEHKKYPLLNIFGTMYINFGEYSRYNGRTFAISEKNVNESIQCDHVYAYSSGKKIAHGLISKFGQ